MMNKKILTICFLVMFTVVAAVGQTAVKTPKNYGNEQLVDSTQTQKFDYHFSEMVRYFSVFDNENALRELQICKSLNPNVAELYYREASMSKSIDEAMVLVRKAVELSPNNEVYLGRLAMLCHTNKNLDESIELLKKITKINPNNIENWNKLYYFLIENNNPKEAYKVIESIEELVGITPYYTAQKVSILIDKKDKKRAVAEWNKLIKRYPTEISYAVDLAELYLAFNDSVHALETYNNVLAKYPGNGYALFSLYDFYKDKDSKKANDYLFKSLEDKTMPYDMRANDIRRYVVGLVQEEKYDETERFLAHLESLYGDEVDVCLLCKQYYFIKEDYAKSLEYIQKCIDLQPENEELWTDMADIYVNNTHDYEALHQLAQKASVAFPSNPQWNYYQIIYCYQQEKFDKFVELIKFAEKNFDDSNNEYKSHITCMLAGYYWNDGQTKLALDYCQKSLEYNPQNPETLNDYAYFLFLCGQRLDDALKMIEKCVAINKDDANVLDTYAMVLFARKDYLLARIYIQRAISLSNNAAIFSEHYGDILYFLGEEEAAVGQWKKALNASDTKEGHEILELKIKEGKYIADPLVEIK